jgi:hypothetical protein
MLVKVYRFTFNYCLTRSINNVNPSLIGIMQKQSLIMLESEHTILDVAKGDGRKYYFMICDICFWCASVLEPHLLKYSRSFSCPVCQGSKVQAIPLASNEVCRLKYIKTTG